MTRYIAGFVLALLAVTAPTLAFAQDAQPIDGEVIIAWGDTLAQLLAAGGVVYAAVLAFINRHVPEQWRANQLLEKAVDYGFSVTTEAIKGRTVTVRTGSQVLEAALQYLVAIAPQFYGKLGPMKARAMLTARIPFEDAAPRIVGPVQDPPLGTSF